MQSRTMSDSESLEHHSGVSATISTDCPGNGFANSPDDNEPSQESTGSSELLHSGMSVLLLRPGNGEIGEASVVEVHPVGQWLGVEIPFGSKEFVLLRPTAITASAEELLLVPPQRGYDTVVQTLQRTVLWSRAHVSIPSGDLRPDESLFVPRERWTGLEVQRLDENGLLLCSGRIMAAFPKDHFRSGWLGEDNIGVTVLDVFVGDTERIMSHEAWPIPECSFPSGQSLQGTIDYFASRPVQQDSDAHLGGRRKEPYRFISRKQDLNKKESLYTRRTADDEIRKVSSERCCSKSCCQHFPQSRTLAVRQKFYEKSFEGRKEYGIAVGGQFHFIEGDRKRKYVTLSETEVCSVAWYTIHGIRKSTFHSYMEDFRSGIINATHGNMGIKRPRLATVQAMGSMTSIIKDTADQMPHQMRNVGNGRIDTLKFLPAGNNWKQIRASVNETNDSYGLPPVSQSTVSRVRKELFGNVAIKPSGSTFAKCSACDEFNQFLLTTPKGTPAYEIFFNNRQAHLNHQQSCRKLYATWREESKAQPLTYLCVIHDKMDTAKTALPRMWKTTKATSGLGQLPMNVTGMVAHGHVDGAYAHYAPALWPGDSNATISSLAKLFRRLEGAPLHETRALFEHPPANSLIAALMRGKSRCLDALEPIEPSACRGPKPLPPKLFLQLDNSAKDNKNQFLMAFLSLLTARGVFKEIQAGFLVVGHTHEDIDAYFSHLSKELKKSSTYILSDLMKAFMTSQKLAFMPEVIQEVADFKSYVEGYICSGAARLVGISDMHLFKFYVDNDGVPVMKFKESAVDPDWSPVNRPPIRLWKVDENGRPILPTGPPKPVPFKPMWGTEEQNPAGNQDVARDKARKATEKMNFIKTGLRKYVEYWESGMSKCVGYAESIRPYLQYWRDVIDELDKPLPQTPSALEEGFWPQHDWRGPNEGSDLREDPLGLLPAPQDVTPEDEVPVPYFGPANEAPKSCFNPWRDVRMGSWVLVRPSDPEICPVWQGRALSDAIREEGNENYGKFLIKYWEPVNKQSNLKRKYHDCWYAKWVPDQEKPVWCHVNSVLYATWSSRVTQLTRTIPRKMMEAAIKNLEKANATDP